MTMNGETTGRAVHSAAAKPRSRHEASPRVLLNLGCGSTRPPGWYNADASVSSLLQALPIVGGLVRKIAPVAYASPARYLDLRRRWPFDDATVDVVYASHVLEHLSEPDARAALREARRVLRPGGVIRIAVPDLYSNAKAYVAAVEDGDADAAARFLYVLNMHVEQTYPAGGSLAHRVVHALQRFPHQHKYMYDAATMKARLREAGFATIVDGRYGDSRYVPEIRDVESTGEGVPSLYVEAVRPA